MLSHVMLPSVVLRRVMLPGDIPRELVRCYVILTDVRICHLTLPNDIASYIFASHVMLRCRILYYAMLS